MMKEINKEELKSINGGGISIWGGIGIGAIITFLVGVIDGHINLK